MTWYTKETFLMKIVNNLLRCSRSADQLFYIQPYFAGLYRAIKDEYSKWKVNNNQSKLVFYKGADVKTDELKQLEVGNIVQNLCWFSTTYLESMADTFTVNVLFVI